MSEIKEKLKPTKPDGYANHMSGNWDDVPEWAIARINFLEEVIEWRDRSLCPKMHEPCPNVSEGDLSCHAVKHCYNHLCNGACGANIIYVTDAQKKLLEQHPDVY